MTLNDLNQMLINGHSTFLTHEFATCQKIVDGLLRTLDDSHGEVQNMAIKCLGPFVNKAPDSILGPTIEKVSLVKTSNTIDTSIPALAVRAIVISLPHPVPGLPKSLKVNEAYNAISRALIPRLVGRVLLPSTSAKPPSTQSMLQTDLETGNDSNSLDVLTEVARCFGPLLQETEVEALTHTTIRVLESDRCGTVIKKKAIAALSALSLYFSDSLLASHISYSIERLRNPHLTNQQRRLYIASYGSLARSIPPKFGPYLKTLAPFVLAPLSEEELEQQQEAEAAADGERDVQLEEVREASLAALETFLDACAQDMKSYAQDTLDAAVRFLKYEPNINDDDDDEEMDDEEAEDDFEVDEDFEEETGFEDEDDVSWKVRKGSAKVLHALINTLAPTDPAIFDQIAPALISRFKEREESVRTEIIATLAFLVTAVGNASLLANPPVSTSLPQSRKRRRGFSESLDSDLQERQALLGRPTLRSVSGPDDFATQHLATSTPEILKGASKLLKSSTVPTKQAIISLLKDLVSAQRGGLSEQAGLVIDPVVEAMNSTQGSSSNVAGNALRIEALLFLRVVAETHSSKVIQPHLQEITPTLVAAAKDRYARVSGEVFSTIEAFIDALTPPRSVNDARNAESVGQIYTVIADRIQAQDTDTEVRQKAIQALGLLIGRTSGASGASLLSQADRFAGQQLIAERLRNELTRLASVRAIDTLGVLIQNQQDFKESFVNDVSLELGNQFRKASRSLRGASLSALRTLAVNAASRGYFSDDVVQQLVDLLVPLLATEDLHMMSPALIVLAAFARNKAQLVAVPQVIEGICTIARSQLASSALDALMTCIEAIGKAGAGKGLMEAFLRIAPQSDADVTGQLIGTLLVAGGDSVGVKMDAFVVELQSQADESKRCLSLSVLGETGLRMGTSSKLSPENFIQYFGDKSEKVKLAAAVALGRAGAGDVPEYLPRILNEMAQGKQYLLLHSVKELLQHSNSEDEIRPYTQTLWENIINSGQAEDNKVVGAECIGRLAIIDPAAYLPQLQTFLKNPSPTIRGMVISALRYVFSDTTVAYNANLRNLIVPLLATMLEDADLDNQRLAFATFNSALQNKPDLVLPQLSELLHHAIQATLIRPELVREVSMGPFKHKIDDGLDIRKSAYETLYALLDTPASRQGLDITAFYDRIVAGISDEHEIKILCCLVLGKLLVLSPSESVRRLESLAQQFRTVLNIKPKENAVKQELEKLTEQNKAVIKVTVAFNKSLSFDGSNEHRAWKDYYDGCMKGFPVLVKAAEDELRGSEQR